MLGRASWRMQASRRYRQEGIAGSTCLSAANFWGLLIADRCWRSVVTQINLR